MSVPKADFPGAALAYYSFGDAAARALEPAAGWDLLFTRYTTPLSTDTDTIEYTVTGVLQNAGVEVAALREVDPASVAAPDSAAFSAAPNAIGHDWKTFDLASGTYTLPDDRVYFVRTPDSLYRLTFVDFEGGSTGTTVFSLEADGTGVSSAREVPRTRATLFPNPAAPGATADVRLALEAPTASREASLRVYDGLGRTLHRGSVPLTAGPNRLALPNSAALAPGTYSVEVVGHDLRVVERLVVR